ncbi:hypothetical protein R3O67_28035 [Bacillus cereus]|uniref:hypothetical protein n=1 Tax=Bacillus cereus TaxID=1396 RepID=UPI003078C140
MKTEKKKFLKKALTTAFLTTVVLPLLSPFSNLSNNNEVVFADTPETEKKLITAPGFFTKQYSVNMGNCKYHQKKAKEFKEAEKEKIKKGDGYSEKLEDSFDESEKSKGRETKAVNELMGSAADSVVSSEDSKQPDKGIFGLGCAQFNFMQLLSRIIEPVNITQSSVIMSLVYKFQIVALGLGVLLVAIFGMYYALGNETTDPIRFLIRGFFTLWFVYYLPYFAQDILNVNNMITFWISTDNIPSATDSGHAVASGVLIAFVGATNIIIQAWATAMAFGSILPGVLFVGLLIFIIVVGFLVKQLVTIMFWWYSRLLMLIFLVMLGPLFMIMMILPKTASYGQKWIRYFVGETFTQTSMVIGFYFASYILGNLGTLNAEVGMNLLGDTLLLYGIYLLMSRIPHISKNHIGGADIGGLSFADARHVGNTVGDFMQKAGFAMAGNWARGKMAKTIQPDRDRRAALERKAKQNDITDEEKAELNNLTDKLANIERREEFANRMGTAMLNGSFKQAMGDVNEIRRKADEKAKAKFGADNIYEDGKSYGKKLLGDSDNSLEEAKNDIEKAKQEEFNKYKNAVSRINNNEQRAKEQGDNYKPEEFDAQREAEERKYNKALGEIKSRDPENEARKIREKSREHLEKMAEGMVGNGFDNQMERRAAISKKADELEKMLRSEMKEEAIQKAAERKEAQGKVGIGANQVVQAMNMGVNELSEKLQEQGMSKEQADANAAQALQKMSQLNELKQANRKQLKTHEANPNEIKGKQLEKLTGVLSDIGKLESEINDLTGNIPSQKVAEAFNGSVGAVSNLLQEKGKLSAEEATKRAKEIVPQQLKANSLSSQMPKNNENLTEEQKQNKEELAKTMSKISELSGGISNDAIKKATDNGFQGITESLKKQGHSQETAQVQATNLGQLHNKIESLKNENSEILSLNSSDLTRDELNKKQAVISEISSLKSSMATQGGGLNTSDVQKTLEPHMGTINKAKEDYNNLIENNREALGSSAKTYGENAIAAAAIANNGGINSVINNTSGSGTHAVAQYLEGMGAGQSSINIAKGIETLGQVQSMVGKTGDDNSKVFAQHLSSIENGTITPEVLQGIQELGGGIREEMDYLNSPSVSGSGATKSAIVNNFVDAAKSSINSPNMSMQAKEEFGRVIGEAVFEDYKQTGSVSKKFEGASTSVGSGINFVESVANKELNIPQVTHMFEEAGFDNPKEAAQQFVNHSPEIQNVITDTMQSGNTNSANFQASFEKATQGMDSSIQNGVKTAVWKEISKGHSMETRTGHAFEVGQTPVQTISGMSSGTIGQEEFVESLVNNSVPNAPEVGATIYENAPQFEAAMNTVLQTTTPNKAQFTETVAPLLNNVEAPVAQSIVSTLWDGVSKDSSMNATVASRTTQALGSSPVSYVQEIASGNINSEVVIESFENSAVPNAGEAGRVLVESAPEIAETLTFTLNSESPNGNLFREDVAATLVTGGMDSKVANSVAGSMWTDAASNISMDSRFDNSWESTSTVIEQLASPEVDVEVIVNTMAESMEQNAIPDAKGTAIAMRDNAEKIKEVIEVTMAADKPSMETAKTELTGILSGVKNKETKQSLINSILKDITQKMTGNKNQTQNTTSGKDKENQ